MKNTLRFVYLVLILNSCSPQKKLVEQLDTKITSDSYKNQFTGLLFVDAETNDTIYKYQSEKYFTPASNTKIFTLYTALETLPNRIPALKYLLKNDTLFFQGTGDPALMHPYLNDSTAITFLRSKQNLVFVPGNFTDSKYGPGWAWDDFQYYYSPERNALPVHGNVIMNSKNPNLMVKPAYFKDSVLEITTRERRKPNKNLFYRTPTRLDTIETPFITNTKTSIGILEKALNKRISTAHEMPLGDLQTLNGIATDSLYKRMMHESDNFIAEQLLLVAAATLTDTLDSKIAILHILENQLKNLKQAPRWVDGSGLSRYNLFTPESMVAVLSKLYTTLPKERLLNIFPAAGVSGTLKDNYSNTTEPYLFAKSGSLSNNYCLSGYLLTKSGKTLIFSFMNNHYRNATKDQKASMQAIFEKLRDTY